MFEKWTSACEGHLIKVALAFLIIFLIYFQIKTCALHMIWHVCGAIKKLCLFKIHLLTQMLLCCRFMPLYLFFFRNWMPFRLSVFTRSADNSVLCSANIALLKHFIIFVLLQICIWLPLLVDTVSCWFWQYHWSYVNVLLLTFFTQCSFVVFQTQMLFSCSFCICDISGTSNLFVLTVMLNEICSSCCQLKTLTGFLLLSHLFIFTS